MQGKRDSFVYMGPMKVTISSRPTSPFDSVVKAPWACNQNCQEPQLVDASPVWLHDMPHVLPHSKISPRIPNSQEVPHTRLKFGGAQAPSSLLPQHYDPQESTYYEYTNITGERQIHTEQQQKCDGLSTKNRPTKPERTLCKSLARMAFLFHQANNFKDKAEAEKMLALSLNGANADQRSCEYATTVLHALFAEIEPSW